jgi:hypothetical protein
MEEESPSKRRGTGVEEAAETIACLARPSGGGLGLAKRAEVKWMDSMSVRVFLAQTDEDRLVGRLQPKTSGDAVVRRARAGVEEEAAEAGRSWQ